jgi:hypothetical protein
MYTVAEVEGYESRLPKLFTARSPQSQLGLIFGYITYLCQTFIALLFAYP